jgi:quinol monooxygenase YgiN
VIICIGTIKLDPAKAEDARAAMTTMMDATLQEEGCRGYTFAADLSEPGVFHLTEQWDGAEAIDRHLKEPHMADLMVAMGTLGVTEASIWQHEVSDSKKMM